MAKIISKRTLPPDDKMFSGGPQVFSPLEFSTSHTAQSNQHSLKKRTMPAKSIAYDPNLGEKFFKDSKGFVIGRGKSSQQNWEDDDPLAKFQDPQEAHDEQMAKRTSDSPQPETEEEGLELGKKRIARWKHQNEQLRKQAGSHHDAPPIKRDAKGEEL